MSKQFYFGETPGGWNPNQIAHKNVCVEGYCGRREPQRSVPNNNNKTITLRWGFVFKSFLWIFRYILHLVQKTIYKHFPALLLAKYPLLFQATFSKYPCRTSTMMVCMAPERMLLVVLWPSMASPTGPLLKIPPRRAGVSLFTVTSFPKTDWFWAREPPFALIYAFYNLKEKYRNNWFWFLTVTGKLRQKSDGHKT